MSPNVVVNNIYLQILNSNIHLLFFSIHIKKVNFIYLFVYMRSMFKKTAGLIYKI